MNINNNINNNNNSNSIKIVPSSFTEDDELQLKRREKDDDASFQHEKKELNVSLDLFEILEDRYAYEGCNRCMFIFFYFYLQLINSFKQRVSTNFFFGYIIFFWFKHIFVIIILKVPSAGIEPASNA